MKELLIDDILNEPVSYTTSKWIIERIPFVFNNNLKNYIDWKEKLSTLIGVDSKAIVFTGSSSVGFSLNPKKNFSAFHQDSDIDVAIISNHYFDAAWYFLRQLGPQYHRFKPTIRNAINEHRVRFIYHGTIATDRLIQILPFGIEWVNAMNEMKGLEPTIDREINFRIYKDFEALKSYQNIGIMIAKDQLLKQ